MFLRFRRSNETMNKPIIFINCTAHSLSSEQTEEIIERSNPKIILELKEIQPEIYSKLINCPSYETDVIALYNQFSKYLLSYLKANKKTKFYIHLPIGSPYFMALFFSRFPVKKRIEFLFSHTDRESIEEIQEDGRVIKKSVFRFQKFLTLKRNSLR